MYQYIYITLYEIYFRRNLHYSKQENFPRMENKNEIFVRSIIKIKDPSNTRVWIKNRIIHELIKISSNSILSWIRWGRGIERKKDGNPFYLGCHRLYLFLSPRWTRPAGHFQTGEKLQRFVPYEKYGNARGLILDTVFLLPPSLFFSFASGWG